MMTKIFRRINDLSIRYKLFITYLALITLPTCLFLLINMYYTAHDAEERALYSLRQVLGQTQSFLEFKTESTKNLLDTLVLNDTVQELAVKAQSFYTDNIGFWMDDNGRLTKVFYISQNNPDVSSVVFYMKAGLASVSETENYKTLSSIENEPWFGYLLKNGNRIQWLKERGADHTGSAGHLSAVKGIINAEDVNNVTGVIRLDLPISVIRTALDQSLFTESTCAYLVNSTGEILCSSSNASSNSASALSGPVSGFKDGKADSGWITEKIGDQDFLLGSREIRNSDWRLVLAVPLKDIRMYGDRTRNQMLLILLIVAPLTLPLSFLVAASATKRIRKLINHMRKVVDGNFDIGILPTNNDEIGQLTKNFNYMLTRMAMLIDEKFELGREMKSLELKALQAQINPHFLYNTLDLIDWISVKNRSTDASLLVKALSRFYKLSLSNGRDIVSIRSEIEHVKTYVQIQNMRFEDKIRLSVGIPEMLYDYSIPKIILQPLVENAILHGIFEGDVEFGTIRMDGRIEEGDIILRIQDDGAGMSEETLSDIPSGVASSEAHGYGIRNINERLKLYYGNEYGLSYSSAPGAGTTVEIKIKAISYSA